MGLCLVPTCAICQGQFVELDQLWEYKKTHNKRNSVSNSNSILKKKKRKNSREMFYCHLCLQSFISRKELFYHKLGHMADSTAYHPVEPHFDFEDERVNALLRENADLIFTGHRFTKKSADFNFPHILLLNRDGWTAELYQALDLVANVNNQDNFFNGICLDGQSNWLILIFVPHENNAFFKKPIRIDQLLGENSILN